MQFRTSSQGVSRRVFGATIAAGAALPAVVAQQEAPSAPATVAPDPNMGFRGTAPEVPPFSGKLEFTRKDVAPKVSPFPMTQVRLLPSLFADAQEWNRGYMSRLTADRLLYNFHANAGLPVGSVQPFGGWEQADNNQRGSELRGHFLSAIALLYASTGDKEAKSKGDYMVAEMAKCQEKLGGGYLSAFQKTYWDRLEKMERVPWAPFYTIHKIMAGMLDMYQLGGNRQALRVLEGMANWADEWTAPKTEEHMQRILTVEFGGIAETLYSLAAITNNDRWARTGDRFQKRTFLNPLALRRDELRGLHVNTHVPQVIAAARRYEISGDMRFHDVADYFFDEVANARSYVTGGTSNNEVWMTQPRRLAAELPRSVSTQECCCAYNMLKLARHLYSWNPDPAYFDYYERVMLNHRIGTIRPKTGLTQYFLSLAPGVWKTFNTEDQSFWCCTGTGVEEYAKLNDSIYWRDAEGVYVNLFVPSELDWAEKGLKLRQETKYPDATNATITVTAARPGAMPIRLRIPGWLNSAPAVKLNGRVLEASAAPGSYLTLQRSWKAGDRIELELPMQLRVEAMPDDPTMQAFLYGPQVLAGDLGNEGLTEAQIYGSNAPRLGAGNPNAPAAPNAPPRVPQIEVPTFTASSPDPAAWIKAEKPMTFRTTGQKRDVTLVPLNSLFDRRYSVYWKVT
jgi:DUF1680 family protein